MKKFISLMTLLGMLSGCGYVDSGTWEDDPRNWVRAFNELKPEEIEVVRSRYMTTPHWSHEFEYFFHIKESDAARERFLDVRRVKPYASKEDLFLPVDSFFQEKPSWFLPKGIENYDIWIRGTEPRGNFRIFVDRSSGDIYVSDNQI